MTSRPETKIPDEITLPYPIIGAGTIESGFGRGSAELGIPTANIPVTSELNKLETGIYYGWCRLVPRNQECAAKQRSDGKKVYFNNGTKLADDELETFPMAMSIGWNPFYNNETKTAEVHIIHKFRENFYGADLRYAVMGHIRPELNYTTKEALIADINKDIEITKDALSKPSYEKYRTKI